MLTPMLEEIRTAVSGHMIWSALALTVALPDICAAMETPKQKPGTRYQRWYEQWVDEEKAGLDAAECYKLRNAILHSGTTWQHLGNRPRPVFFHPDRSGTMHNIILKRGGRTVLAVDLVLFCNAIVGAVERWLESKRGNAAVQNNLRYAIRVHPDGLPGFVSGPVIT